MDTPPDQLSMNELFHQELCARTMVLDEGLEQLEKHPERSEPIRPMIEAAHSLKGAALIMGLKPLAQLAEALETYLVNMTSGAPQKPQCKVLSEVNVSLHKLMQAGAPAIQTTLVKSREELEHLIGNLMQVKPKPPTQKPDKEPPVADSEALDPAMLGLFFVDLETQTHELTEGLLALEANVQNSEAMASLMRAAHSIKGAARVLGLSDLMELARAIEDCFVSIQKLPAGIDSEVTDLLLAAVDLLRSLVKISPNAIYDWLGANKDKIRAITHSLKSRFPNSDENRSTPEKKIDLPPAHKDDTLVDTAALSKSEGAMRRLHEAKQTTHTARRERVLRLTADYLTRLMGLAGELLVESRWLQPFADELLKLKKAQYDLSAIVDILRSSYNERLFGDEGQENLLELQRKTNLCRQSLAARLDELELFIRRHGALSDRLYREIISSRLCPFIEGVEEMPRLARDLARQLNKKVVFELIGRSTTIDRDILDKLQSPLNHLLRNAIDHGIELPEERIALGKKPEGHIRLEARHRAGVLSISVSDDGRGINIEKLRQTIIEKKLVEPSMASQLTETELLDFLFLPGFTTASKVTDISGRGIGLNVVQSMVHDVGGQVRVHATDGQGMTINLQLPLTLSVLRALLVEIAGEPYAFPLGRVEKAVVLNRERVATIEQRQYVKIDDQNIGLVSGHQILGLPDTIKKDQDLSVVVLSDNFNFYGVVVDRLLGEKELVVQELEARLGKVSDIGCGALMEDGSPVLVIDAEDMVRSIDNLLTTGHLERLREINISDTEQRRKRILVVDDSITVREVECRILENEGYEVDVAVNGIDGWNSVRIEEYDLVITDVDMPRMNGIEFVRLIKNDSRLRRLPVMIVSYKERGEDRKIGLEAGADYYLAKSSFHDDTFIQTVKDLIGDGYA